MRQNKRPARLRRRQTSEPVTPRAPNAGGKIAQFTAHRIEATLETILHAAAQQP
jgi:hypothetical protein